MKILQINTVYGTGSTGKIARDIHDLCAEHGISCLSGYRCKEPDTAILADSISISSRLDSRIHGRLARYTMLKGCFSRRKTARFLKKVDQYAPDLIHIHNLHGSYVNIGMLTDYIKKKNIPVVFTLHDCWAFTGICSHFAMAGCESWKTGCGKCPQKGKYAACPVDLSNKMWENKKKWFSNIPNMVVITPSAWLREQVEESFLRNYPVRVIPNGINLDVFKPTASNFKEKYHLIDKKIVLFVAFEWGYSKGLDVIVELAKRLTPDYKLVMVGSNDELDTILPPSVLTIHKTNDQRELAQLYTAADVLVNPTREEVLGLTNIEALACGTPVVTFRTGGSPECLDDTCGMVVEKDDVDALEASILRICWEKPYSEASCIARAKHFDKNQRLMEYMELYKNMACKP